MTEITQDVVIAQLEDRALDAEGQLMVAQVRITELEQSNTDYQNDQRSMAKELSDKDDRIADLDEQITDLEEQITDQGDGLASADARIAELREGKDELFKSYCTVRTDYDEMQKKLGRTQNDVKHIENKMTFEHIEHTHERNRAIAAEQSAYAELGDLYHQAATLKREVASRDAEREMCVELLAAWMDDYISSATLIEEDTYSSTCEYLEEFHPEAVDDWYPAWEDVQQISADELLVDDLPADPGFWTQP